MTASHGRRMAAIAVALALLVCAAFAPVLRNDFVTWDDGAMIVSNPFYRGFSPTHLWWMFTTRAMGHYEPLTWLTLALDWTVWGTDPRGYHLTNVLLHAANAVVFCILAAELYRRLGWRNGVTVAAAGAALLFALHPLRVESVAWASERRDVLSALFYLLTVLAYLHAQDAPMPTAHRRWLGLSLGCFVLSLLAKAWGMTLPVVLLVLDVYPLRRFTAAPRRVLAEKIPYLVLAGGAAVIAASAVAPDAVLHPLAAHGALARLAQAAYGLCFYLWKTVAPVRLSPLYLLGEQIDPAEPRYLLAMAAAATITAAAIGLARRQPWLLAAWACYVVIVSPVLGIAQSGPQLAADRYTYLATLPWALLAGAGVRRLWLGTPRAAFWAAATLGIAALGLLTARQTRVWRNTETLWSQAIRLDSGNWVAWGNRGLDRETRGDLSGARADLDQAIALNPRYALAYNNRGALRKKMGDLRGAASDYEAGLRAAPPGSPWHAMLAQNLATLRGDPLEAAHPTPRQ